MRKILAISVILTAAAAAFTIVRADGTSTVSSTVSTEDAFSASVRFPVADLGNCANRAACRTYCDQTENIPACAAFAKNNGLMTNEEAERSTRFAAILRSGEGPGGCTTPEACRSFCQDFKNFGQCVKFAKAHNAPMPDGADKLQAFLDKGGKTPGGCDSKDSCQVYCSDLSHAEECAVFAKALGFTPPDTATRIGKLAKQGQTPGGCASKDACETYCADETHRQECADFAEKAGLLPPEKIQAMRQIQKAKGPGDCDSRKACDEYCRVPEHQEECLNFAKDHGVLDKQAVGRIQDASTRLRLGLEQMPPEIAACIRSSMGENAISRIQSGELVPSSRMGISVKSCFEKFGQKGTPADVFKGMPATVEKCVRENISDLDSVRKGDKELRLQPQTADAVRACFKGVFKPESPEADGPDSRSFPPAANIPPIVLRCLKNKYPELDAEKMKIGADPGLRSALEECMRQNKPIQEPAKPVSEPVKQEGAIQPGGQVQTPPTVSWIVDCLRRNFSDEEVQKIMAGQLSAEDKLVDEAKIKGCQVQSVINSSATQSYVQPTGASIASVLLQPFLKLLSR